MHVTLVIVAAAWAIDQEGMVTELGRFTIAWVSEEGLNGSCSRVEGGEHGFEKCI